ncbi:hypothetical protein MSIMFB_04506 [Mycobacterium simulans]|uniref:F5/8 type C domain-containing protein n=1 Tax=Mycobacterium simulans TaxID=627089 RepID=A0A7Z7INS3_9MYCO|nr:hypothetical protein [Mycobacterium simulans]SOJ57028.1 hypothetical protein MSIMFB_04506 [Mycobacterium simulans]
MSNPPIDHERDCAIAMTEGFLADVDGDGLGAVQVHPPAEFDPPAESGDEHDAPITPAAAPREDTIDVGDSAAYASAEHLGARRLTDEPPIDLDGPSDSSEEQPPTQGADTSDPSTSGQPDSAETPLPGSDLVDQLTSTSGTDDAADSPRESKRGPRYNKNIAGGFAAATVAATLIASGALLAMRSDPHTSEPSQPAQPNTRLSVLVAPSSTTPAPNNQDSTIPYTATSVGCLPGSTAAQSVAGPDSTQAWVCVTGGNVGQYLVLNLGRSMVVTAVSITPGWVGADASGADQWHQHRVLTRVQWSFNDTPPTVVPQETASVHGEAAKPMPTRGVLASRIIMLVQETGRAPADTTPTTSPAPGAGGGLIGEILGTPAAPADPAPTSSTPALPGLPADQSHTDPADNTFAVSAIKIFGHPPQ